MNLKSILGIVFIIIVLVLIGIYYFMPFKELEFSSPLNYNFTIDGNISDMQFYPNMRFENKELTYKISDCNIKKQEEMRTAFDIVENLTSLSFNSVSENEDIIVTCDERAKFEGGMFIAGEGGPDVPVVRAGVYNVILHGKILLLRSSDCESPNVAIHELFHVLGFIHSNNPNNVMYNYTKCSQTIGDDIPNLINELYSISNYPDLVFENVSASMSGRYLDLNMTIRNRGLKESKPTLINVNMNNDTIKQIELKEIEIGNGVSLIISNVFVGKISLGDLELIIDYSGSELDKSNNNVFLEMKK